MSTYEKLAAIVAWMDAAPKDHCRELHIEAGVEADVPASVCLHAAWVPSGPNSVPEDLRPLGSRTYYAEGSSVADALTRLHVPRPRREVARDKQASTLQKESK